MSKFAERLKELREDKGLSLKQLAKALNISDVALGRWEKGTRIPNIETLEQLSKFFKVTTDYMLGIGN